MNTSLTEAVRVVAGLITVEPLGIELPVAADETLMAAAERAGWRWPTVCHGQAECTACFTQVVEGHDHVVPPGPVEKARLEAVGRDPARFRLACQLRVTGDARVEKRGVRPGNV